MNRIKPAIAWIFRNRFWFACGLTAVACLATWFVAWQALDKQREEQAGKINSKKGAAESVLATKVATDSGDVLDAHPNTATEAEMEKRIKSAADAALEAWQVRYDQQKDILVFADAIPQNIRTVLASHLPMEKPYERELVDSTQRGTFGEFFVRHMPGLVLTTINATWNYDDKGKKLESKPLAGARDKPEVPTEPKAEDLVYWTDENQELWHSKVTEFKGYDGNTDDVPRTDQMLALQQDVWILEAMLKIIGKVNEGYVANDLAPIKRLDYILVGKEAMSAKKATLDPVAYKPEGKITPVASAKKSGRGQRTSKKEDVSLAATKGDSFSPGASSSPFHGRYVDRDYSQLNKSEIERIISEHKLTPRSYLAVAKRVPVSVAVKMDERRIADFLAAAANSPFTFEVRSLRINNAYVPNGGAKREQTRSATTGTGGSSRPEDLARASGAGGAGGGGGGLTMDEPDGGGSGKGGSGKGPADEDVSPELRKSFDVRVEFLGIVKIYNPPDRSLFFPDEKPADGPEQPQTPTSAPVAATKPGDDEG
jgi:hypothetical protein